MAYEHIVVEERGAVGLIRLHRPQAMNALSAAMMAELARALDGFEAAAEIGAVVLLGSDRAFAAGADIKEMAGKSFAEVKATDFPGPEWRRLERCRKPIVAAVAGFALGGGLELAMMCDIVLAAPGARFGQPEIALGTIPGLGGTQRLVRAVGKAKAMEMCLTGRAIDAAEAERAGLVSRIVPAAELEAEALKVAATVARLSRPAVLMLKEAIGRAFESPLAEGLAVERGLFQATFATADRAEGMAAFVEKREPRFRNA